MDNIKPYPSIPVAFIEAGDMCLPPTKFITTNVHNLVCPIAFLSRSRTVYVMNLFFFFFFFNEQSKITVYDYVVRKQYKDIHCNHSDQYTFNYYGKQSHALLSTNAFPYSTCTQHMESP